MSHHRRHRSDSNQNEIIEALQGCGAFVVNLNQVGNGCPDLAVYLKGWHMLEIKTNSPIGWKYKPAQEKFIKRCPAQIPVLTTKDDAVYWAEQKVIKRTKDEMRALIGAIKLSKKFGWIKTHAVLAEHDATANYSIEDFKGMGHTDHCAKRIKHGDGECECKGVNN